VIRAVRSGESPEAIDPHDLPSFNYAQPAVAEGIAGAAADIGLLGLNTVVFFAAAFVAFLRYDLR